MKAAQQHRQEWEEANWLRLIHINNQAYKALIGFFRKILIAANILLYIFYKAFQAMLLMVKLLLLTEPAINKIERDETWIFRQIK